MESKRTRVEPPLDARGRRLKAGFERMLNGFEGLDELSEHELRMLVQELFAARAPMKARSALAWLAAERGLTDLCLTLYAGGASMSVMLEAAVLGSRWATFRELLLRRPSHGALRAAMDTCLVVDAFDAAHELYVAGAPIAEAAAKAVALGKLDWVQLLLSWGAPPEAVLVQAAFDLDSHAMTLAIARGANPSILQEGPLLAELARLRPSAPRPSPG